MSRVGLNPITIPSNVNTQVLQDNVNLTGPKGSLIVNVPSGIKVESKDNQVLVTRTNDEKTTRSLHGLIRSLINNAVVGVSEGYEKKLEVNGVGFKVNASGQKLTLSLGFSHDVIYEIPSGVQVQIEQNIITLSGIDKQQVGQVAAEIRALKKPEPYKGKGIRYVDEYVIRKAGKAASGGKE